MEVSEGLITSLIAESKTSEEDEENLDCGFDEKYRAAEYFFNNANPFCKFSGNLGERRLFSIWRKNLFCYETTRIA
jgi:hypothetical protein